ncbi:MAG: tRNA pseudouridine(55) synthase TruB [Lentisphaeria bacterium]
MIHRGKNCIDGLLLVDKPVDWTSHDVVNCVRRRFDLYKTGHCGTLDPFATGLLILLLGKATKLQDLLMSETKIYSGVMRLGEATDSQDRMGNVTAVKEVPKLVRGDLEALAGHFLGDQFQIPPMASAIKVDGKPLYKLAHQGKTIERKPRPISIKSFDITDVDLPDVGFRLCCSKGTYVRTIADDFGEKLGCGAHLEELRREQSGDFRVENAVSMDLIKDWELSQLLEHYVPMEDLCAFDAKKD